MNASKAWEALAGRPTVRVFFSARALLLAALALHLVWIGVLWLAASTTWLESLAPRDWLATLAPSYRRLPLAFVYSLAAGLAAILMPVRLGAWLRARAQRLLQNEWRALAAVCLVILLLGAGYARFHRGYADELLIFAISKGVATAGVQVYFAHYSETLWLGRQHPPLIPLMYGFVLWLAGPSLFLVRLLSLAFGIGALILTYALSREFYDREPSVLAALLFGTMPLFYWAGASGLGDVPLTFLFLLGVYLTLRLAQRPTLRLALAAAAALGTGLLFKYTMVLVYPVLLLAALVFPRLRRHRFHLAAILLLSSSFLAGWVAFAYRNGILGGQVRALTHLAAMSTSNPITPWMVRQLAAQLLPGLGMYNLPWIALGAVALLRRRSRADVFVLLWIAAVALPLLVTLPNHRYFLPVFPALAIMGAHGLRQRSAATERAIVLALLCCTSAFFWRVN
ncbi:MAG TPA: glycosyltransferase family 39 protein [Ardenticatenaceae bacterium]|nr:glycosyltransferase family 39 protein [Ardenticatenaceae bacterium]